MKIKRARQILKSLADDTRLRIINLLSKEELIVSDLCRILKKSQPSISKHLMRLRLTGILGDRREGINVYYYLIKPKSKEISMLLKAITSGLADLEVFKNDIKCLTALGSKK
ncbi:MAG: metalloregulator ArsR/SmtB family transcription factor [Candidatus Omnitrophica bacterium]|nr:metalloregulator ArsR/SmtB family transcription factor [Candidatus Omnitrophota bacterium]